MPSLNTENAILSNAIKVDSSYNVGIGGAADASFKLKVSGTTSLTGALSGTSATFTATSLPLRIQSTTNYETATLGSATGTMAYVSANGLYGMYIGIGNSGNTWLQSQRNDGNTTAYNLLLNPQGGNVGIGTSSPSARLAVVKSQSGTSSAASGVLRLENTGANYTSTLILTDGTTNDALISYLGATQSLGFGVGSTANQMVITSSGNVLIGTTTDNGLRLQVSGVISATSTMLASGGIRTTEGSVSANSGSYATIFTLSGSKAVFQVFTQVPAGAGDANNYTAYATILFDGSAARIIANNGGVTDIILSGLNVQARQQSGNPQTIEWKYLRIQ